MTPHIHALLAHDTHLFDVHFDRPAALEAHRDSICELVQDDDPELGSGLASRLAAGSAGPVYCAFLRQPSSRQSLRYLFYFDASLAERVAEHLLESVPR